MQLTTFTYTDRQKERYNGRNNPKNIQSRVVVIVHDTSSYCALQLYEIQLNSSNGCQLTERTRTSSVNDQKKITPYIFKAVMVIVYDISSYCVLQLYEVSFKKF